MFLQASQWVFSLLMGPLATSIAVIAVASTGFLMLSGRINVRRGATVVVGCFILFGVASSASGLRGLASSVALEKPRSRQVIVGPLPSVKTVSASSNSTVWSNDPYAEAEVRR